LEEESKRKRRGVKTKERNKRKLRRREERKVERTLRTTLSFSCLLGGKGEEEERRY